MAMGSHPSSESPSEPSLDNRVGDPTSLSPSEDLCLYGDQMLRMAKALDVVR